MRAPALVAVASLIWTSAFAADNSPLPPGKPAGIKRAQSEHYGAIFVGAAVGLIAIGVILAKGTYNTPSTSGTTS